MNAAWSHGLGLSDEVADDLSGGRLPIGRAAGLQDNCPFSGLVRECPQQPRLAHAGVAQNGNQLAGLAGHRPVKRIMQDGEFDGSAYQWRLEAPGQADHSAWRHFE
jgi:hypothetical protein